MKFANGFAVGCRAFLLASLFSASAFAATDIAWVQKQLDTQNFTSIEDFLKILPQDYKTNYTLMYDSKSLQQSTPSEPRVISYGTDGSLVFGFNSGDVNLRGSDTIELIQFNLPETKFEFYEIAKSASTGKLQLNAQTDKCVACHRADPRPNWQPYDNWPGAFGSLEDELLSSASEESDFKTFLQKNAVDNPRYNILTLPQVSSTGDIALIGTPNAGLVDRLAQWNYMRAARLVRATLDYDAYKYAVVGAAGCADQFANFFPASKPLPANWNTTVDSDLWVSAFIYLFQSRGIDWQVFPMLIDGVTSDFFDNDPFVAGYTYGQDLIANVVSQDAELQAYAKVTVEPKNCDGVQSRTLQVDDCTALAKLSAAALAKI